MRPRISIRGCVRRSVGPSVTNYFSSLNFTKNQQITHPQASWALGSVLISWGLQWARRAHSLEVPWARLWAAVLVVEHGHSPATMLRWLKDE